MSATAITEPDDRGRRSVHIKLNGQVRPIETIDRSISTAVTERDRADPGDRTQVAGPLTGVAVESG